MQQVFDQYHQHCQYDPGPISLEEGNFYFFQLRTGKPFQPVRPALWAYVLIAAIAKECGFPAMRFQKIDPEKLAAMGQVTDIQGRFGSFTAGAGRYFYRNLPDRFFSGYVSHYAMN